MRRLIAMLARFKASGRSEIAARDIKAGTVIEWQGEAIRVDKVCFANGRDGGRPTMIALPEHTKSALAIKVVSGERVYLFHPAQRVMAYQFPKPDGGV